MINRLKKFIKKVFKAIKNNTIEEHLLKKSPNPSLSCLIKSKLLLKLSINHNQIEKNPRSKL
jgi:hypothetical protein